MLSFGCVNKIDSSWKVSVLCLFMIAFLTVLNACQDQHADQRTQSSAKKTNSITRIELPNNPGDKGSIVNLHYGCSYNSKSNYNSAIEISIPKPKELQQLRDITKYTGIPLNFEVFTSEIQNALATIINEQRYIIYDQDLLRNLERNSSTYWNSMSILAHEVGHHLSGHTFRESDDPHQSELEADEYSGFVLYKMGATLENAQSAILEMGNPSETPSHPSKSERLFAVKRGWDNANKLRYEEALPPPPEDVVFPTYLKAGFGPKKLISESNYRKIFIDESPTYGLALNLEGVIVESFFDSSKSYMIYIEKGLGYEGGTFMKVSYLDSPWETTILDTDYHSVGSDYFWLRQLMIPGRRIRFDVVFSPTVGPLAETPFYYFAKINQIPIGQ